MLSPRAAWALMSLAFLPILRFYGALAPLGRSPCR